MSMVHLCTDISTWSRSHNDIYMVPALSFCREKYTSWERIHSYGSWSKKIHIFWGPSEGEVWYPGVSERSSLSSMGWSWQELFQSPGTMTWVSAMVNALAQIPHGLICHISFWMTWDLCVHVSNPLIKSHSVCLDHIITFWSTTNTLLSNSKLQTHLWGPRLAEELLYSYSKWPCTCVCFCGKV